MTTTEDGTYDRLRAINALASEEERGRMTLALIAALKEEAAREALAPCDPESIIDGARVYAYGSGGRSSGRCAWRPTDTGHCPAPVPDSEFFCPEHTAAIQDSSDQGVVDSWRHFQEELVSHRAATPKDPKP